MPKKEESNVESPKKGFWSSWLGKTLTWIGNGFKSLWASIKNAFGRSSTTKQVEAENLEKNSKENTISSPAPQVKVPEAHLPLARSPKAPPTAVPLEPSLRAETDSIEREREQAAQERAKQETDLLKNKEETVSPLVQPPQSTHLPKPGEIAPKKPRQEPNPIILAPVVLTAAAAAVAAPPVFTEKSSTTESIKSAFLATNTAGEMLSTYLANLLNKKTITSSNPSYIEILKCINFVKNAESFILDNVNVLSAERLHDLLSYLKNIEGFFTETNGKFNPNARQDFVLAYSEIPFQGFLQRMHALMALKKLETMQSQGAVLPENLNTLAINLMEKLENTRDFECAKLKEINSFTQAVEDEAQRKSPSP